MTVRRAPPGQRTRPAEDLPAWSDAWAFFLDIDGTLAHFAPSPGEVRIDRGVRALVRRLRAKSGDALAIISGRPIAQIDALFGGAVRAVAGQHGAERRDAGGQMHHLRLRSAPLLSARRAVVAAIAPHTGLVCEWKGLSIALHYRGAPALAAFAHATMWREARRLGGAFAVLAGKRVVELKPVRASKGHAVEEFLREPPFHARVPVCIGDDRTDEDAFAVAMLRGGIAIKVGKGQTCATHRLADIAAVHDWIARAATHSHRRTRQPQGRRT